METLNSRKIIISLAVMGILGGVFSMPFLKARHCSLIFGAAGDHLIELKVNGDRIQVISKNGKQAKHYMLNRDSISLDLMDQDGFEYRITAITGSYYDETSKSKHIMVHVEVEKGELKFQQYADLELRNLFREPAIAHFNGPMTVGIQTINWEIPGSAKLIKWKKPNDVRVQIGTFNAESGCWVAVRTHDEIGCTFPDSVRPSVVIEFPDMNSETGSIVERYELKEFC